LDYWSLVAIGVLGVALILETLLLIGLIKYLRNYTQKMGILLANYKADLEMVLINAHKFDSFIETTEKALQGEDESKAQHSGYG
jgi:hypothetical protein